MEDEDVLQLLTGDDEFDADIDEDAEEALLRDDINNQETKQQQLIQLNTQSTDKKLMDTNESIDDEDDDDRDDDAGRRGKFKSERIMSLVAINSRRREIPESLDSVKVNHHHSNQQPRGHQQNNNNNRRYHHQSNRQKYHQSVNESNDRQNRYTGNQRNMGLLPLPPPQLSAIAEPFVGQSQPPHSQQPNNPNINPLSANTIHINPHFIARNANPFEQQLQQIQHQQQQQPHHHHPQQQQQQPSRFVEPQFRPPLASHVVNQNFQYPNQMINNNNNNTPMFDQPLNHPRHPFMPNNFNNNDTQNRPPFRQPPPPPHHHMPQQIDNQWTNNGTNTNQMYGPPPPPSHINQQIPPFPQQMPVNRPMNNMNPNPIPPQHNFLPNNGYNNNNDNNHNNNNNIQSNQPMFDGFNNVYHPHQPMQMSNNNFQQFPTNHQTSPQQHQHHHQPPLNRFPVHNNYQQLPTGHRHPNLPVQAFHSPNNQPMFNQSNNINVNTVQQLSPPKRKNLNLNNNNNNKRPNFVPKGQQIINTNKSMNNPSLDHQNRSDSMKAAQQRTKRAKQLLTKKQHNIVKEVPIVNDIDLAKSQVNKSVQKEIEASVGVDEEYKKKLEEQKRRREEIVKMKEQNRKAMAAQRLKTSSSSSQSPPVANVSPIKSLSKPQQQQPSSSSQRQPQKQQQIATLVNRSAQLPQIRQVVKPAAVVVAKNNDNNNNNNGKQQLVTNRVVINTNQKRSSVLIKGLATATNEFTIRKLCKAVGGGAVVESINLMTNGGQKSATVTFSRRQDAVAFTTKYERSLVDLSVIQVSLI
ncbi:putative uncharacterized protein DDB_G0286901 [Oppia nitens]|uniref:putative uncharacterized protein DDB_G0286901 n=1 Tax=Oppia nitens TaxID=1686743 RepID=UPI0023DCD7A9|nr:putative uncharacterized protein DDB_G0286901 [Oppia nitens]